MPCAACTSFSTVTSTEGMPMAATGILRFSVMAFLLSAFALSSGNHAAAQNAELQPPDTVPFVDAHVHLNDERMQLELMQRFGAKRAVVFWGRNSDNDTIAAAAERHPDRFIAFV